MTLPLSRRSLLAGVGAAALSPALPTLPGAAPPASLYPVFEVGIEDYPNWRMIAAETLERAMQIFREDIGLCEGCDGLRCAQLDPDGECEHSGLDARKLSGKAFPPQQAEGDIAAGLEEMQAAGWRHQCSRCYYDDPDNWYIIDSEAVCSDCLTTQEIDAQDHDWFLDRVINEDVTLADLSVFALLRPADFTDDTIREVLAEEAALHPECLHLAVFARKSDIKAASDKENIG